MCPTQATNIRCCMPTSGSDIMGGRRSGFNTDETRGKTTAVFGCMCTIFVAGRPGCSNMNPYCSYWASVGECDKNPTYMTSRCSAACGTC